MAQARMTLKVFCLSRFSLSAPTCLASLLRREMGRLGSSRTGSIAWRALTPGILIYERDADGEDHVAVDQGVIVKTGLNVLVSVRRAFLGKDLGQLRQSVEHEFLIWMKLNREFAQSWPSSKVDFFDASRASNMSEEPRQKVSKVGQTLAEEVGAKRESSRHGETLPRASGSDWA